MSISRCSSRSAAPKRPSSTSASTISGAGASALGPRRARTAGERQAAAEVVAGEREPGARDERVGVAGRAGERGAQQAVGARVEGGIAGLARPAQVGVGERDARRGGARIGAHGGLQAAEVVAAVARGGAAAAAPASRARPARARGAGGRRRARRRRPASTARRRVRGHGEVHGGGSARPPRWADGRSGCDQAGGWGTGAWAGSTRLSFESNAGVRQRDVRERAAERLVVHVDAVAERDLLAALLGRQQRARDDAQLDVDDVVREPPPVREAGGVARQHAEAVRARARRDAEVDLQRVGRRPALLPIWVSPGTPVSSAWTMSVRSVSLTPRPNRAFSSFAGSGASARAPKFAASFAGEVALYLSFLPIGMIDLVDQRVAEAADLHPVVRARGACRGGARRRSACARSSSTRRRRRCPRRRRTRCGRCA